MSEPVFDSSDIQGNIAPGFKLPHQYLIGVKGKAVKLISLLKVLSPKITSMQEVYDYHAERVAKAKKTGVFGIASFSLPEQKNLVWFNMALGNGFLKTANISEPDKADQSFSIGLYNRATTLGDSKDPKSKGYRDNWIVGNSKTDLDILVIMGSDNYQALIAETKLFDDFQDIIVYREYGGRLLNDTEHFGFRDGVSMPAVRGFVYDDGKSFLENRKVVNSTDDSPEFSKPGSILVWPGQFIFGYPQQDVNSYRGSLPDSATTSANLKNGSFLVFRRLTQDVKLFYDQTDAFSKNLKKVPGFESFDGRTVRAKMIGRWENGNPLSRMPDKPAPSYNPYIDNYFMFRQDLADLKLTSGTTVNGVNNDNLASKCPYSAHIRKVNPRDEQNNLGGEIDNQTTFRPLRRGIPFGKPFDFENLDNPDNQTEKGLLFMAYVTSIQKQFENLQQDWANSTDKPEGVATGNDMLIGQNNIDSKRSYKFSPDGSEQTTFQTMSNFIIPTGGDYLFAPSVTLIKKIAAMPFDATIDQRN